MQRQSVHFFVREPSGGISFPHTIGIERAFHVGGHDVELPSPSTVLNLDPSHAEGGKRTKFFLRLPTRCRLGSFSLPDRASRDAPSLSEINPLRALL